MSMTFPYNNEHAKNNHVKFIPRHDYTTKALGHTTP